MIEPGPRRSLVVDDNSMVLQIIGEMLSRNGWEVTTTNDALKALDLIETEYFDIVLTDLMMPDIDGWTVARKVKERSPQTRVVLITAWGHVYKKANLSERGVDLLISKPVGYEAFTIAINELFSPPEEG
jgi:DNA-binding response OmpR family regulator